ncbi:MAG TPA: iron-sulfur cluster assembly scaffold protein, partial [Chloroflexi bacterium]|nr:iron-sulfur cluster assembly scaffold protein [Chloroflexota bacterium]
CGDRVRLELRLDEAGRVAQAAFSGEGCAISMAAASILAEYVHGRSLKALRGLTERDALEMLGVDLGRARTQCALVALRALKAALKTKPTPSC